LAEAYAAGLLGQEYLGIGSRFDLHMFVGCGRLHLRRGNRLAESPRGAKPGKPRFKPPFPANFGLYGKPTTINNTQKLCIRADHHAQGRGVVCGPGAAQLRPAP